MEDYILAKEFVKLSGLRWCDAVRLILELYDHIPQKKRNDSPACIACMREIIRLGAEARQLKENTKPFVEVMNKSVAARSHRRASTIRDMTYMVRRLIRFNPYLEGRHLRDIGTRECCAILKRTFGTPSQYKKGRAFLNSIFSYGLRHEWCHDNPVKRVDIPILKEKEIKPLHEMEIDRLLRSAENPVHKRMAPALGLMLWAGIRPHEVKRLSAEDIDLKRGFVYLKPRHTKTGGGRQIPIRPALSLWLNRFGLPTRFCDAEWSRQWRALRQDAGFYNWQQDVLRHTFASYHAQCFEDLPKLQIEMGHRSVDLLRTRYVNLLKLDLKTCFKFFQYNE